MAHRSYMVPTTPLDAPGHPVDWKAPFRQHCRYITQTKDDSYSPIYTILSEYKGIG